MDISTPAGRLLEALKQELKVKNLHYRDIAARLKISERTVKRYFSGKGLTLDVLQQLASIVDLDVLSLLMVAQRRGATLPVMTNAQQAALKRNKLALAVFSFLNFGMTPAQIAQEFDLGKQMGGVLAKLENVGLIRRVGPNGIKLLAGREIGGRFDDYMTVQKTRSTRRFFAEIDLGNPECQWLYHAIRLSHPAALRVEQMMRRFVIDITEIMKSEMDLSSNETTWYRLFVGAEPIQRKKMLQDL